jgi:PAS domain S-box-containing protein
MLSCRQRKDRAGTKMRLQARSWRSATSALLPVATAALAAGILVAELITSEKLTAALFYVLVVLLASRFCNARGIALVGAGCAGLTLLAFLLPGVTQPSGPALKALISIVAIGSTTFLALRSQSSEAALREQASLLDLTHDSIVARRFDDDVITYWSRGAEELYGWDRAEAVGRVGSELRNSAIPPLPLDQIKSELLRVGRWEGELVNNKRDGTRVLVTSRWSLRRDRHGGPAIILVTSNDITERKRAEQALRDSEEQWREVFEHNPVMYFMVSPTGTVLSVNGFGAAQLGYTAAELIGQSVLNVFFEEDQELVKDQLATCVEELGRPHSWEIRKIRKDGTVLWVRENGKAVLRSGTDAIILIACEDITERKRGEQRVAAAYAVTRVLAEADSLATAAPDILRAIGENLEWDWGALWSFDRERAREDAPLRCDCLWYMPDIEIAEFETVSREWSYAAPGGRLGQVWRTAKPIWMVDATSEPGFLRAQAAATAGLHGGVIFPILLDTEAFGAVEFFSRAAREPDPEQVATLSAIGSQIGQFIKRTHAEAALRGNEERWRRLFETSPAGMALTRLDGVFTAANPALQRMIGRAEEEIVGHGVLEVNPEEERAATAEAFAKYGSGLLTERQVEKKYLKNDGTPVWLNITTTLVPGTETAAPFLQSVYMDITERVHFEAELRASEARWRTIFETSAVGIVTSDLEDRYLTTNQNFQRMTGYTEAELRNLGPLDITHEDDRAASRKLTDEVVAGKQPSYRIEKRYRRKDDEIVWADLHTSLVPATETTPAFFSTIIVDITERKRSEAALLASEERWRRLFETSFAGMALINLYGIITAANPALRRMLDRSGEEIVGRTLVELTHEDERAVTADVIAKFRSGLLQEYHVEKRYLKRDGSPVWVNVTSTLMPATETADPFMQTVYWDITDRKRTEAALRASEERWRAMFEIAPVGITTFDFERRRYLTVNESFQRMIGYTEEELRNLTTLEITHEDDRAAMQERIDSGALGVLQSKRYRRKDGEVVWADVTSFVVPATDSTPAFRGAVIVDIGDRKRAEEDLQQAQADLARLNRVMLLGEMTSLIAHEVNQPIAAVITNANAGLRWLGARQPDIDEVRQALGRILRDGTRAGEVIGRIRALVKKVPPRREPLYINEVIREVIALTQTDAQRNAVRWHSRLDDNLPLISADRVQLQQVMINLIINAIEAMAGASDGPRELTIVSGIGDANDVVVEVQDTGPGLDPEQLDRLFQSFYTTKPDGIGMGLAISRSIAEAHGGRLSAAPNNPRGGAVFRLTLPLEQPLLGNKGDRALGRRSA